MGTVAQSEALALFHKPLILLAPEVGLEPTTLRLTALEFPLPPTTTCRYSSLSFNNL